MKSARLQRRSSQLFLWFATFAFTALASGMAQAGSLTDLGYPTGLLLQGPGASSTVYFPMPPDARGGILRLDFSASAALDPRSSITVLADDVPVASVPVARAGTTVDVPIPPGLTRTPFLKLGFVADQTIDDDKLCYDNDVASAWLVVLPDTGVSAASANTSGIGTFWQLLGAPVTISMPLHAAAADVEAALVLSTALVERGITPFINDDPDAMIRIDPTVAAMALGTAAGGRPQLLVPGPAAARALVAVAPGLRTLMQTGATGVFLRQAAPRTGRVRFGDVGVASASLAVTTQASLDIPLQLANLPAGQHVTGLLLNGIGTALPRGESEVATLLVGGDVIWGRAFQDMPVLDNVRITLPERLLADGARVTLQLTRMSGGTPCERRQPLLFTLADGSAFLLSDGSLPPQRFAGFSPAGDGTVPLLTDLPPDRLLPAIPLLAQLLGNAEVSPAAITLSSPAVPTRPFILVSDHAGAVVDVAPVTSPGPKITLPLPDQNTVVTLPEAGRLSILQLVTSKSDIPGLWLKPGPAASLADAALPGDGNVAFYDGTTAPATFDTTLHKAVYITATPPSPLIGGLRAWSVELFVALWLAAVVLVVGIVVRRRR